MLFGKCVVIGISGGIAAYKSCELVSSLKRLGADVEVVMTKNAEEFVTPLTFETLAKNKVVREMFAQREEFDVQHVSLAKKADLLVVAPATADVIAKFANGIADDMLSTIWLATKAPKMVAPAMNTAMYDSEPTQRNLQTLKEDGVIIVEPGTGMLACGDVGKGRMAQPKQILEAILAKLQPVSDFAGKKVLVTAGSTEENIDGVRVITNHSSGKMGCAVAQAAAQRGAEVTLIAGRISVDIPRTVAKIVNVKTTQEMYNASVLEFKNSDIAIMAAAPSDYRLKEEYPQKIKSETLTLEFVKNPDIAATLSKDKDGRKLVIFSAETENLLENATKKLKAKGADIVVANDITKEGAGFNVDTNIITIINSKGDVTEYPLAKKRALADIILDHVLNCYGA